MLSILCPYVKTSFTRPCTQHNHLSTLFSASFRLLWGATCFLQCCANLLENPCAEMLLPSPFTGSMIKFYRVVTVELYFGFIHLLPCKLRGCKPVMPLRFGYCAIVNVHCACGALFFSPILYCGGFSPSRIFDMFFVSIL